MLIFIFIALFGCVLGAAAEPMVTPEEHFFGIPNLDSLSRDWFMDVSDSTDYGCLAPLDLEVLRLSVADYRVLILTADSRIFLEFRMDQQQGVQLHDFVRSGNAPAACTTATAICRLQQGAYFNPYTDRIAAVFPDGAKIGIYQFNPAAGSFALERSFATPAVRPTGIHWALDNFFITDDSLRCIFRLDANGGLIARYGHPGFWGDGYYFPSDLSGYVENGTAHLYVADGAAERLDHLTTTGPDSVIHLRAQAGATEYDTWGLNVHENVYVPGAGVFGFNRFDQRLYLWCDPDSLTYGSRFTHPLETAEGTAVSIRAACGRLVAFSFCPSGWVLRSFFMADVPVDDPDSAMYGHWTAAMSPIHLAETKYVCAGDTLIIDEGVQVLFDSSAALVVDPGAALMVNGKQENPVVFDAAVSGQKWRGLRVNSASPANRLAHATVQNALTGMEVWNGSLDLNHTQIRECRDYGAVYSNSTGAWQQSSVCLCGRQGAFFISSRVTLDSCAFANNTRAGLRLVGGDYALRYSDVTSSHCAPEDSVAYRGTGIEVLGAHVQTLCNTVADNDGPGLFICAGSYVRMVHAWNTIYNNQKAYSPSMLDLGQICLFGGMAHMGDGFNTIGGPPLSEPPYSYRIRNLLIDSASVDLARNYWGGIDPVQVLPLLLPPQAQVEPVLTDPYDCGVIPADTSELPPDEVLFNQAWEEEREGQFAAALAHYEQLKNDFPESPFNDFAGDRIGWCQEALGWSWGDIQNYFTLQADTADISDALRNQYRTTAAWCYVGMGDFVEAETQLHALLDESTDELEQIEILLTSWIVELLANQDDSLLVALAGKAPRSAVSRRDTALVAFAERLDGLVAARLSGVGGKGQPMLPVAIPTRYALYQNYPNPFNPVTEIRFDLPANVQVELKIFNTLGQLVTTLVDEMRQAGAYRVAWDGKSAQGLAVSTGMYIYQLKAGDFTDTKKMLLMK